MRISITRAVWGKIQTQVQKPQNLLALTLLNEEKVTHTPSADRLLWEPKPETCRALMLILENEQGFMRNKESVTYRDMTALIKQLRAYVRKEAPHLLNEKPDQGALQ